MLDVYVVWEHHDDAVQIVGVRSTFEAAKALVPTATRWSQPHDWRTEWRSGDYRITVCTCP
jgi:hypothetical protein